MTKKGDKKKRQRQSYKEISIKNNRKKMHTPEESNKHS